MSKSGALLCLPAPRAWAGRHASARATPWRLGSLRFGGVTAVPRQFEPRAEATFFELI